MNPQGELERGRECYRRRAWLAAYDALSSADERATLGPEDLWRLAVSAQLIGREADFLGVLDRAHRAHLEAGEAARAARCVFWLGFYLASNGRIGQATGWFARARRLLDRESGERVEHGYLLLPVAFQQLATRDYEAAFATAARAAQAGDRFDDPDLLALAVHMQGHARVNQVRVDEGLALFDEAMVVVATGEVSPQITGLIYCSMISACRKVYALRRAREWTAALAEWCAHQPDLVAYTGLCHVYRAEIMQLHGAWSNAIEEAQRAGDRSAQVDDPKVAAAAYYQQGEVYRLRGEFAAAEEAYRKASRSGREPQPGLALLRLAQGDTKAAGAMIRRTLAETADRLGRIRLLPAHIEIVLAVGDAAEARRACGELEEIAADYPMSMVGTIVSNIRGAVALGEGEATAALIALRHAWRGWQDLGAPYESARVRVLLGLACRALEDNDTAALELEAARAAFEELGAGPDLARVDALTRGASVRQHHGLTPRELQVLALVATGRTNRVIAGELFISEKTVARHVSNIFSKLGLPSRSAATAYAYEHGLA